jgi:hypothetical protein
VNPIVLGVLLVAAFVLVTGGSAFAMQQAAADPTEGAMPPPNTTSVDGAVAWKNGYAVDADGAPTAYGPPGFPSLDNLANAKNAAGDFVGVVTDSDGNPLVNPAGGYVSSTALVDASYPSGDQRRYVDASSVNYVALGRDVLARAGADLGDLIVVIRLRTGDSVGAIVADIAPTGHAREISVACAAALGLPCSARSSGSSSGIGFVLFPGSGTGWPRPTYADDALALFAQWGDVARFKGNT